MSKNNAKDRIVRYLTKADITLASDEELILKRWEHIDHLMRQKLPYVDILLKHTAKFNISKFTADKDLTDTQEVFARSRKLNKRYLAHLHIEDIQQDLSIIRKKLLDPDYPLDAKEIAALGKLHDSLTYQLNSLPDDAQITDVPRPVIIYDLVGISNQPTPMNIEDALKMADKLLNNFTDISHEDIPPTNPDDHASGAE